MADEEKVYRSTHKGAQIDEAVTTVLNNDCQIKWGNIVEGSIADQADLQGRLESKVDKTITVNGHALNSNVELTPEDVHALPEDTIVGRYIATDDLKIVLKDRDRNVISEATIPSYNKAALDTLFAGKASIDLDNLTTTGEAHFANPSLGNLDVVGQQLINSKLNKSNVTSKGSTTLPVYFNENGVATPITSYEGNAATATLASKAAQDELGNSISTTYAKRDLSNITDESKTKINNGVIPDYSKGVSVGSGYTVTQPSMALWFRYSGGLWWGVYFWINGIEFGCGGNTYGDRASGSSVTAYVSTGDVLTFSSGYVKVFPLKGV